MPVGKRAGFFGGAGASHASLCRHQSTSCTSAQASLKSVASKAATGFTRTQGIYRISASLFRLTAADDLRGIASEAAPLPRSNPLNCRLMYHLGQARWERNAHPCRSWK
eukprot:5569675-Amphidinium_carterae.1